jgi:hypothetical protein
MARPGRFTPGNDPMWAPGSVWTGAENIASTGIRSPELPARSESPYRLRYPGLVFLINVRKISSEIKFYFT